MLVRLDLFCILFAPLLWGTVRSRVDQTAHDYLCSEDSTYTRDLPWHCSSYVVCDGGHAYTFNCPMGTVFNQNSKVCDWPHKVDIGICSTNPFGSFDEICRWKPRMKLASYTNCAQYYDCGKSKDTADFVKYIMECPYPQLFSERYGACMHFKAVNCGKRPTPIAPCDYIQYKQLCPDPRRCIACHKRHPSCYGRRDGFNAIISVTNYFMYCDQGRTIDIRKCHGRQVFSRVSRRCVPSVG